LVFDEELMIGIGCTGLIVGYISLSVYLYQHLCVAIYLKIYLEISGLCLYFYQGAYATIGQGGLYLKIIFSKGTIVSDVSAL